MMPTLTYPWALLFLLLLPLVAWRHMGRSRGAWQFSDRRLLPARLGRRTYQARWGGLLLRLVALLLAILALTGPRWPDPASRVPTSGISVAMIVDVSVSMSNEDFPSPGGDISRIDGVKKLFKLFVAGGDATAEVKLAGRPNDLIALVTFATHPETACPLTLDHQALLKIMNDQKPRSAAGEGTTNPGDALAWTLHVLRQAPTQRKVIVFLTDGEANVPEGLRMRQAAQLAAKMSIPIYAIDASPNPKTPQEAKELQEVRDVMLSIAKMTEGRYFRAEDAGGLVHAYEDIDRLERTRILSFQYRLYHEGFVWFALAMLVCWLTLIVLESTWWRSLP